LFAGDERSSRKRGVTFTSMLWVKARYIAPLLGSAGTPRGVGPGG
jgi:hypothetical protein